AANPADSGSHLSLSAVREAGVICPLVQSRPRRLIVYQNVTSNRAYDYPKAQENSTLERTMTDPIFLFTVTDRFFIEGRGTVLVPGLPQDLGAIVIRRGDPLILRTPLGDIIETVLQDIEMISHRRSGKIYPSTPILLPVLHPFDISIGTDVYLKVNP
ncbi:MAG: hypothetical protein JWO94_2761, partial [Verrucomicrobiaceae bacterium]|nr:hypothetical protein [Verrucomicrobiaceae bacterium]